MKVTIKKFTQKYLSNFYYFFAHLRFRIFFVVSLSLFVGVLDGFGLAMFLPLLEIADGISPTEEGGNMGKLIFLVNGLNNMGIELTVPIALGIICFFFMVKGAFAFINGYYKIAVKHYFVRKIRIENLDLLAGLKYKYFLSADQGRIQNSYTTEINRVSNAYSTYFMSFQNGILVVVYMTFAFLVDWQFAILVSLGGLISNLIFKRIYAGTEKSSKKLTKGGHDLQGLMLQAVANFKYLKASGSIKQYVNRVKKQSIDVENTNNKIAKYGNILFATREPIIILVVCTVIFIQTSYLNTPLEGILISLLFFYRALTSLMQAQSSWNNFLTVVGSLDNMTEFTQELVQNQEKVGKIEFKNLEDKIVLDNVSLSYGKTRVVKNISFDIPKTSEIALVGESGSGKTSIINMISGLIPTDGGQIRIDGEPMGNINIPTFQRKIGYISQDSVIFNDTVFNNVTFWDEPTPENLEKFRSACDRAAILSFIETLEAKEFEMLGNNGLNLSGGQKQRISIARELYKEIDILILDEATSALDSETEKEIQLNLERLKGFYTIIVIAHRLSTVKNADNIIFLNKGEKVAMGNFETLIELEPNFKRMVQLQGVHSD